MNNKSFESLKNFAVGYLFDDINVEDNNRVVTDWDYTAKILQAGNDDKTFKQVASIVSAYQNYDDKKAYQLAVECFGAFAQSRLGSLASALEDED